MLIEIHMLQNHSPANLNRDDLGSPKTCYFGGVLRSRISSQCLKRSIRFSPEFDSLRGGIRTRRLAELISGSGENLERAQEILSMIGFKQKEKPKKKKKDDGNTDEASTEGDSGAAEEFSKMLIFMSRDKLKSLSGIVADSSLSIKDAAQQMADVIAMATVSPDIALCGRMLEPKQSEEEKKKIKWKETAVEAALQVAHAISTHSARPEIDYFVAADDVPGEDAGAGHIGETMFASACFYKYYSIDWDTLVNNLEGNAELAAHTVGAFLLAAARTNPSGKQNSFAAHNFPDCILVEFKDTPVNYANAFTRPVSVAKDSDLVDLSIGQLLNYVRDIRQGYFAGDTKMASYWFSPNHRHDPEQFMPDKEKLMSASVGEINQLVGLVLKHIGGYDWETVQKATAYTGD